MVRVPPTKRPGQAKGRRKISGETVDVSGLADLLGITENMVRARCSRGLLPFHRWGSRIIFLRSEVREFLAALPGIGVEEALKNELSRRGE